MKTIDKNTFSVEIFDRLLDNYGLKKTTFAKETHIPYPTVAGWSNNKRVPLYGFELAKHLIRKLNLKKDIRKTYANKNIPTKEKRDYEQTILKKVEVAFWGKNIDPQKAIQKAIKGDKKYAFQIMKNLYYKDATKLLGAKNVNSFAKKYADELGYKTATMYKFAI